MQSDKFLFAEPQKALDKIECLASCYKFGTKEILQIRLLAEEIISVIKPTLNLSRGRCWVTTNEKAFAVTIDCDGGMNALDKDTKEALLKMSRSEKKGIGGVIGKIFEFLSVPDADYSSVSGSQMICSYSSEMGYHGGYHWNPTFFDAVSLPKPQAKGKEANEHDLEMSIIEGFADDIRVGLQKAKSGVRLEVTVVKNFTAGQIDEIEF